MEINNKQKLAIEADDNPIVVIAGAGSGKTFVLVQRIIYLVKNFGYHPSSILAFTFTNKAANEVKHRINESSVTAEPFNWIGTFHSICLKILRHDSAKVGRHSNFLIIDEDEKMSLIKEIYMTNELNKDLIAHKKMVSYISTLKGANEVFTTPQDVVDYFCDFDFDVSKTKMIATVYFEYLKVCEEKNLFDFDDLIIYTLRLLKENPETREKWQNTFSYILVDEFQDTSYQQLELIKLLSSSDRKNIFVVGDPDQMIYSWRGAYSNVFEDFKNYYHNCEQIILDQNYRSTKNILNISNILIGHNNDRIEKNLFTNNNAGDSIMYYHGNSSEDENYWIVSKIRQLVSCGYKYSDILILYRSNYLSRSIEQALIGASIPYIIYGGFKFFQRKEIKDVIAYLKLSLFDDDLALSRIYNVPKRKIGEASYIKLVKYASDKHISIMEAINEIDQIPDLSSAVKNRLSELKESILRIRSHKYISFVELIDFILKEINYIEYLKEEDESYRMDNINELKKAVDDFQKKNPSTTLLNYLQEICLYTDTDQNKKIDDCVSLMTVHNSKGLEYKVVFLTSFNDGEFPSCKAIDEMNLNEERRIAYVAMTRAKERLLITSSSGTSYITGAPSNKIPSRFLSEISKCDVLEKINVPKQKQQVPIMNEFLEYENVDDESYLREDDVDYFVGESVVHQMFGVGVVVNIYKDMIDVAFQSPIGVKKLVKNHKIISKLRN